MPGSVIVNNLLNGAAEIVGILLLAYLIRKSWCELSKALAVLLFVTGGALAVSSALILTGSVGGRSVDIGKGIAFVGRGIICLAFAVIYNYTGELFPTTVRNSAIGLGSMSG